MRDTKFLQKQAYRWALLIKAIFEYKNIPGQITDIYAGARQLSYSVQLLNPLQLDSTLSISENIALSCKVDNVIAYRTKGQICYQIQLPKELWLTYQKGKHTKGLEIGLTDHKKPVEFSFDPPHHLIVGTTRAGKSYTVQSILLSLAEVFSTEQLAIALCDYHGDFERFENEEHLINFPFGTIASTLEQHKQSVDYVYSQMCYRIENKLRNEKILVLVIDEVEALGEWDRTILAKLRDIGNQGAKFQVFMILSSKKPTERFLPNIPNVTRHRWIGKVGLDAVTTSRLVGQKGIQVNRLTEAGDFLHINDSTIERFLVASIPDNYFGRLHKTSKSVVSIPVVELKNLPEPSPVGRPKIELEPQILAYYWMYGPNNISLQKALNRGWSRTVHERHKEFCIRLGQEYLRLKNE